MEWASGDRELPGGLRVPRTRRIRLSRGRNGPCFGDDGPDGDIMRCCGNVVDQLQLESARDAVGVGPQQWQQPVVKAAAVTDAAPIAIERYPGNEHPVDACGIDWSAVRTGFRNAAIAGHHVLLGPGDRA